MSSPPIRHFILDRDGVLNREPASGWLANIDDWVWEEGSLEALQRLAAAGARISVVTNQSGIGRGVVEQRAVDGIHDWLQDRLADRGVTLAGIYVCPHAPNVGCECRKPQPGLIGSAIADSGISPGETVLIGDDHRDLAAGRAAGVTVVLVCTGKGSEIRDRVEPDTLVFENLLAAVTSFVDGDQGSPDAD